MPIAARESNLPRHHGQDEARSALTVMVNVANGIDPRHSQGAHRLGLVTRQQMVTALVDAIENPVSRVRIVEVPEIRKGLKPAPSAASSAA